MVHDSGTLEDVVGGIATFYVTSLPVLVGILFGADFACLDAGARTSVRPDLPAIVTRLDGGHYLEIIEHGYSYDPARQSTVAFFPAYPLLSRGLRDLFGWSSYVAAVIVANLALGAAFIILARYARLRWPGSSSDQRFLVLAAFGLWPASLFFRMAYAESVLVLGMLILLYGIERHWPLLALAVAAGFVTAVRPVGVAVSAAFAWHVMTRPDCTLAVRVARLVVLSPVACWGLLAYMMYLQWAFGSAFAFAQTQEHWTLLEPPSGTQNKWWSLLTLEPIWGVYVPGYVRYWANIESHENPLFSLMFWNPILFVAAAVLLWFGAWKGWLTACEVVMGTMLLAIPYVTRSYEMSMASHGRFAAVVVVNYLVVGRLFARSSALMTTAAAVLSSILLCTWTALFAGGYHMF